MTFQVRLLHNQEDVNIDRYVLRKLSTKSFENALYDICTFLVVEHLELENLSRGCAKTPILTVYDIIIAIFGRGRKRRDYCVPFHRPQILAQNCHLY